MKLQPINPTIARPALHLGVLCSLMLLGACSSVPPYEAPKVDVPAAFKEASLFAPANPDAAQVPEAWWTVFKDEALNEWVTKLNDGNPSLKSSAAAVAQAQAALTSSRSALFPAMNVSTAGSRSANVSTSPPGTSYNLQGGLSSWELDLWNRVGAGVESSDAKLQASHDTLAATRLSLQATLVQSYFSARSAEAQSRLLEQTVLAYTRSLGLTQDRYQGGVASASDVAQAQTQLKSAQVQLSESRLQRAQLEHAIAALLGMAPASLKLQPSTAGQELPAAPKVPVQLPAQLLERRPDIAAAERQVAAANAQIGAAKAAFFPTLTLSANAGYRGSDFGTLVQSANKFWSIGPTLALNVFDAGARSAAVDSARATYEQTVASYKQTVLGALQEVEDNLVAVAALQEQTALQQEAVTAANRALEIAKLQYIAGTVSYLNVVSAQSTALSAQANLLNVRNRHLFATAQLLKNIAGRWQ